VIALVQRLDELETGGGQGCGNSRVRDARPSYDIYGLPEEVITVGHAADGPVVRNGSEGARYDTERRCNANDGC
jgi:hypothetical protein